MSATDKAVRVLTRYSRQAVEAMMGGVDISPGCHLTYYTDNRPWSIRGGSVVLHDAHWQTSRREIQVTYGGSSEVLEVVRANIAHRYPRVQVSEVERAFHSQNLYTLNITPK